jgi:hypothetical protein
MMKLSRELLKFDGNDNFLVNSGSMKVRVSIAAKPGDGDLWRRFHGAKLSQTSGL